MMDALNTTQLGLVLALILVVGGGFFLLSLDTRKKQIFRRMQTIRTVYETSDVMAAARQVQDTSPIDKIHKFFAPILNRLSRLPLSTGKDREKLQRRLSLAGLIHQHSLQIFMSAKIVLCAALTIPGLLFPFASSLTGPGPANLAASGLACALFGAMLPDLILSRLVAKRLKQINAALPDALDLLCICTNAGQSLDLSIERVAREMKTVAPALSHEFATTFHELRFLPDRQMALRNLADRTDLPSVRSLVVTLIQTQKFGTPITVALKSLSDTERKSRILRIEEQAAKLPAMITLPLMFFILPTVFIIVGSPAALHVMKIMKGSN